MKQSELIAAVATIAELSHNSTGAVLNALGSIVQSQLKAGDEVTLPGIGKLSVNFRAARTGSNPATGAVLQIPAKKVPKFSAAKALKDATAG